MPLICKPFVFVRHGETPLNRDKVIGGSTDVPLTDEGEQQARSAAPILGRYDWNGVAVSSLKRAQRTLELALPGAAHVEQYDTPLIVAHSGVYRVIRYHAFGTPYGDRVGNAVPMWISPGETPQEWQIVPLAERD